MIVTRAVACFHTPAMRCALEFMVPDHLRIGTDYAHPVGGPDKAVGFVKPLEFPDEQCEKILWKNVRPACLSWTCR